MFSQIKDEKGNKIRVIIGTPASDDSSPEAKMHRAVQSKSQIDFSKIKVAEKDFLFAKRDSQEFDLRDGDTALRKKKFDDQTPSRPSRRSRPSSGTVNYVSRPNSSILTAQARQKRHELKNQTDWRENKNGIICDESDDGRKMEREIINDIEKGLQWRRSLGRSVE